MDCSPLKAAATFSFSKVLSKGVGLRSANREIGRLTLNITRLNLRVCNALQEEEGRKHAPVLSTSTVFKVAGVAATVAALIFTLPLPVSSKKRKELEKVTELDIMKSSERGKSQKRIAEKNAMLVEERVQWTEGLPVVKEKIAYTSLLDLHERKKLKHIIKYPNPPLGRRPQVVLIVLDDDRVVRSVLPAFNRDEHFWKSWKTSKLGSFVVEAFTPPTPKPEVPWKDMNLPFWTRVHSKSTKKEEAKQPKKMQGSVKNVKQSSKEKTSPTTARLEQLERARKELERTREIQDAELRRWKLQQAQAAKETKARALQEKQLDEKQKKLVQAKQGHSEGLVQQQQAAESWNRFWDKASRSEGFRFMLGMFFFWLFYQTIVLGVKKRRKDYEDRLKIERAEAEERKKLEEWEDEAEMAEAVSTIQGWSDSDKKNKQEKRTDEEDEQNPQLQMGLRFMRSGARVRRAKGKRPPKYLDLDADVRFEDVAGLGDIRRELEEIVDFFKYKEKYLRRGSKIPSGILLCGEPGTGKTLLAKAVAGEAGVNFFSISASQFVEIYVGVGASRVRALYQEAKENAPAVVFIDELDAVGRQRGLIGGSGGQERDATLNQLLTCLDGFEGKGDVITVAATNRVDILDTALVRPGRFDRKIFIPKPSIRGRIEILKVHARNKPMADDIDYDAIGSATDGMVGAQLANVVDVAALNVLREGRTEITTDDLLDAASLEEGGHADSRPRSSELWHKMALNEAALAVAAANFPDFNDLQLVSIVPRTGEDKGAVRSKLDSMKFQASTVSRQGMMDYMTMQLAPRAADELVFGSDQMCTIWTDHYNNARRVARYYVFCGLSKRTEVYGMFHCWSELDRYYEVDRNAKRILEACYNRARRIVEKNEVLIKELADLLIEIKVVKKEDFWKLAEQYGNFELLPPLPVNIRRKKLEEFREKMIMEKRSPSL